MSLRSLSTTDNRLQGRLFILAALFVIIYALILTLSPAVRARSWAVEFRWSHWLGVLVWFVMVSLVHVRSKQRIPDRDPYLLPVASLLIGWGLMTIWRLIPEYGLRQTVWVVVSLGVLILGLRLPSDLRFLRRFKYLWLTTSMLLLALTLFLGTNPLGYGPRMWLGCCGIYFQPSELLKLLLIAYLAAYLAERYPFLVLSLKDSLPRGENQSSISANRTASSSAPLLPLLAPTLFMTGLALMILVIQRDLGAATIFLFLYASVVYFASGRRRVLVFSLLAVVLAGVVGYVLFDVVRVRVDAWLNPWLDPSGDSYQIVQSLMAIANGGLMGRGPGIGSPGLVPVAHSDLIFSAIAEEHGLVGSIALLLLLALIAVRGLRTAICAADAYQRYLAAGLTVYLVGQGLLIIGGNLRMLPLTGVTLPFVSYGGSSLLTSCLSLLILLHISQRGRPVIDTGPGLPAYQHIAGILLGGLGFAALFSGWWAVLRAPDILVRTDNPRRAIADRYVPRGDILDRRNQPINVTIGDSGGFLRVIEYPELSNVVGYNNPTYAQAGLEASLDEYLRGLRGNPGLTVWWHHLLFGQPPPGLDVRLSLDLELQQLVDEEMRGSRGALVLLDAQSGEILVMSSHPSYDANRLDETWSQLIQDEESPLLNRATMGRYPLEELQAGLFAPLFTNPAIDDVPTIRMPTGRGEILPGGDRRLSPLQVALMAATVSAGGVRPAPQIVAAVNTPLAGWVILPPLGVTRDITTPETASSIIASAITEGLDIWGEVFFVKSEAGDSYTWFVGGTSLDWDGQAFGVAILLEEENPDKANELGKFVLMEAMLPGFITQ